MPRFVKLVPVMTLVGCEQSNRTGPPNKHQKVALPTQDIALFFHGSIRTVASLK